MMKGNTICPRPFHGGGIKMMKYESLITYHSKDMANVKVFADRQTDNKRPMGHIAHLSYLGPHKNMIPFAPFNARGPMTLIKLLFFYVRKLSCKIQLFWLHSS
jgi:hypothetical protein